MISHDKSRSSGDRDRGPERQERSCRRSTALLPPDLSDPSARQDQPTRPARSLL